MAEAAAFAALIADLRRHDWVVYSKAPFAGPDKLLRYLGHYTHRVAISNSRLISCDDGQVVFHYRDRTAGDVRKTMSLPADEFLRRFLCHVLPSGFQRIRHYGLLASRTKKEDLSRCRELLAAPKPEPPAKKTTAEWLLLLWASTSAAARAAAKTWNARGCCRNVGRARADAGTRTSDKGHLMSATPPAHGKHFLRSPTRDRVRTVHWAKPPLHK